MKPQTTKMKILDKMNKSLGQTISFLLCIICTNWFFISTEKMWIRFIVLLFGVLSAWIYTYFMMEIKQDAKI